MACLPAACSALRHLPIVALGVGLVFDCVIYVAAAPCAVQVLALLAYSLLFVVATLDATLAGTVALTVRCFRSLPLLFLAHRLLVPLAPLSFSAQTGVLYLRLAPPWFAQIDAIDRATDADQTSH